jgi:hypothetical protein
MVEGDPIVVSESTRESFSLLAEEFGFAELLAACSEFVQPSSALETTAVSNEESNSVETAQVELPRVVITVKGRVTEYESLHSRYEMEEFVRDLTEADDRKIRLEGIEGSDHLMEKAIKAVYSNTAANFPNDFSKIPFLAYFSWKFYQDLSGPSTEAGICCLNLLHEMAPTSFDKARLLLLSQCDSHRYGSFIPLPTADWDVIDDAVRMLARERNGRTDEARELLRKLNGTGLYDRVLSGWRSYSSLAIGAPKKAQSGEVTGTPDIFQWFRRLFMTWFRPQSVGVKNAPTSVTAE